MRELKILAIVVGITGVLYLGIEPYAHSQLHPHVAPADFEFKDTGTGGLEGDAVRGETVFMQAGCVGCHGLASQGIDAPMDDATASMSFGVVAPDLSSTGLIYEEHFLAALIKNPAKALKVEHKFDDSNPHPMPAFYGLGGDVDQEVADMVAYLQSIAPPSISNEAVFEDACVRCHSMHYDKKPMSSEREAMMAYMGMLPPDVSMSIRAKGEGHLTTFINDPQKHLEGTAMPRVGLTEAAQGQVIDYMESVGDSKKEERERVGMYIIVFFIILSVFAVLWKRKVWQQVT